MTVLTGHKQLIPRATEAFTSYLRNKPPVDMFQCIRECTCAMPIIRQKHSPLVSFGALHTPPYDEYNSIQCNTKAKAFHTGKINIIVIIRRTAVKKHWFCQSGELSYPSALNQNPVEIVSILHAMVRLQFPQDCHAGWFGSCCIWAIGRPATVSEGRFDWRCCRHTHLPWLAERPLHLLA